MIEQANFTDSSLGKAFEKQLKMQLKKIKFLKTLNTGQQLKSIGDIFSKDFSTTEANFELEKNKKIERQINSDTLTCKSSSKKRVKRMIKFKKIRYIHHKIIFNKIVAITQNDACEKKKKKINLKNEIDNAKLKITK